MTSKEFAAMSGKVAQIADQVKPEDGDSTKHSQSMAVYHLRSAAKLLREVGEFKASKEGVEG
jgi:hypothetical protein